MKRFLLFLGLFWLFSPNSEALLMKGKIEVVKGRAYVYRNGRVLQARDDMTIYTGDLLETSRQGSMLLELIDIGLLKLKPGTQVKFPEKDDDQIQASRLNVPFGEVWSKVRKLALGESFEIKTPNAVIFVSNAIVSAGFHKRSKKSNFKIIEGDAEVHKDQNHYFLTAGEQVVLDHRKGSKARLRKIDIFRENQEWKRVVTIREKLGRKIRESLRTPDKKGKTQDLEAPLVHIVSPVEGLPIKKLESDIRATIYEDNLERVILNVNGKTVVDENTSLKTFTKTVTLKPGVNKVELKAIDRFGNVGSDVKEYKIADLPPSVSIFYPFDNLELNSRFVNVQGVIDDPDIREVFVYLNNRQIARDRAVPTFNIPVILDVGENLLRVEVTNAFGLKGVNEITVYTTNQANINIQFNQFFN